VQTAQSPVAQTSAAHGFGIVQSSALPSRVIFRSC
jgi:hypothetical protein